MKFKEYNKFENWSSQHGYKGKKNKTTFDIRFNERRNVYWIFIEDAVTKIVFNSLWRAIVFKKEDIESAFKFCEDLANYYKKHRITQISNCESRIDEFLDTINIKKDN